MKTATRLPIVTSAFIVCGAVMGAPAAAEDNLRIGAFVLATANAYAQMNIAGIEQAAEEAGNVDIVIFDGAFDGARQLVQIQDAVATGRFDGFVIFPNSGVAVVPGVREANEAGIPSIAAYAPIGTDPLNPEPQIDGVIGTVWHPNNEDGRALGRLTVEACRTEHPDASPCKVAYISGGNAILFEQVKLEAFRGVLEEADIEIQIVSQQEGNFLVGDARTAAENILQANPDLNVLSTSADQMTLGAEQAVNDAGITGITLVGTGSSFEGVEAVREGRWFGSTVFLPVDEGRVATQMLIDYIQGQAPEAAVYDVVSGSPIGRTLTRDNIEGFEPQWSAVGN